MLRYGPPTRHPGFRRCVEWNGWYVRWLQTDTLGFQLVVFFDLEVSHGMQQRSFPLATSLLFAVLLSLSIGTLNARDADLSCSTFAAAQQTGDA